MTTGLPSVSAEESVAGVTARIREWLKLKIPGIVWIRYVSDVSRESVLERVSFAAAIERIEFKPPDPAEAANWLEDELASIAARDSLAIVAVDFSSLFNSGPDGFAVAFRSLNLRREVIARMAMVQLWWIPASAAPAAETEALDLASWFQLKMTLSETAPELRERTREETGAPAAIRSRRTLKSLQEAVSRQRRLVNSDPDSYLPSLAASLNALAERYRDTRQLKEAQQGYLEALVIYRRLAEVNPKALPYVALTLNNLGNLCGDTQRMQEARQRHHEALDIYRRLAVANPEAYLSDVATTLNNLGNLYRNTQRMKEAEQSYQEALATYRHLAEANPEAYSPYVATTLNNLGILYSATQRMQEAEQSCIEAQTILEPLWKTSPELHGDQMARILGFRAQLVGPSDPPTACDFARQALAAAYDPALKQVSQELIDQFCLPPTPG